MIEDNPQLMRDIQSLEQKPEFMRLKRHVFVEHSEVDQRSAEQLATEICTKLRDTMLNYNLETGP